MLITGLLFSVLFAYLCEASLIARPVGPLVRQVKRPVLLQSARSFSAHPIDPMANLLDVMTAADDQYLREPKPANNIFAAFTIAKAARNDPVIAEFFNVMSYWDELDAEFAKQFRLPQEVDQVISIGTDENGAKYLNVRNGLLHIKPSKVKANHVTITRPLATVKTISQMMNFSDLLTLRFDKYRPVGEIASMLNGLVCQRSFSIPFVIDGYFDYGLFDSHAKFPTKEIRMVEYCERAELSPEACQQLIAKLALIQK